MVEKKTPARHPVQPLVTDNQGIVRFKKNAIVELLLRDGRYDMNRLAMLEFSTEDREQFAQLIGYSLNGFGELPYVSKRIWNKANAQPVHLGYKKRR